MNPNAPIGMPRDVEYRLKALDKRQLRWPALDLFVAVAIALATYIVVTYTAAK